MGYTKDAISGFSWQSILKLASNILTLLKIAVIARILSPQDFGLFSLAAIALGISEALTQTGVNLTIIQSKFSIKYFLNTAWIISIIRGLLISIIMMVLGILMGKYFDNQDLLWLITLSALVPIIKGFINPAIVTLQKKLLFFQDSIYRFIIIILEIILAIVLTLILKSVYALSLSLILAAIFEVIVSFTFFSNKPKFEYIPNRAKDIFKNAKFLSIASLLNYLNENVDDFLIGKTTGTYHLGLYHNAYSLSHKANYELSKSVHHGTLPIYSKIHHDKARFKKAFHKTLMINLLLSILVSLPLFMFPALIVRIILGEQWLTAIPLILPLTLAGITQALILSIYTLLIARKKFTIMNWHLFANVGLMISLIILFSQHNGALGASWAIFISRITTMVILVNPVKEVLLYYEKK